MASGRAASFVIPLAAVTSQQRTLVGGKAAALARLVQASLPVPEGFVITCDAYRAHLAAIGLAEPIRRRLARAGAGLAEAAAQIRRAVETTPVSAALSDEIARCLITLGEVVAVRSSAIAEDLADHSFAGQHDTSLDVRGAAAVVDAVRRCWASLFSERAVAYRAKRGFAHDAPIACLIQRMVPAECAGVAFTADPLTGERDRIVVNAVRGLGEALVAGRVTASEYVLRKGDGKLLLRRQTDQTDCVPESALAAFAPLALAVESLFRQPQDLEWAWADGRLFILQSRPITNLKPEPVALTEAERPILGYLDRWREMFPGVGTPLLNDLAVRALVPKIVDNAAFHGFLPSALAAESARLIRIVRGRLHLDLDGLGQAMAPALDPLAIVDLLEAGKPPPLRALRWSVLLPQVRALKTLVAALRRLDAMEQASVEAIRRLVEPYEHSELSGLTNRKLVGLLRLEPDAQFGRELRESPPANALARGFATPFYTLLCWMCRRWAGESEDAGAALVSGLTGLVEVECAVALWELAETAKRTPAVTAALEADPARALERLASQPEAAAWLQQFRAFLDGYGHRAIEEVELARPRWREEPAYPLSVIASYLRCASELAPRVVEQRRRAEREALERRILERLRWRPLRRWAFRLVLEVARKASVAGENTKFEIMRVFWVLRRAALELGRRLHAAGRLGAAGDVFFLELAEIEAPGARDLPALVERRRRERERWQRDDPPRVIDARGRPVREGLPVRPAPLDARLLSGIGSSPGVARGPVRIVQDPSAGVHLQPGEILVAPYTDPAWTPLFVSAGAVVVEIGSLLSHASIVARELGIPSVVAVRRATHELADGEAVEVDGSAGTVRRLAPAPRR